MTDLEHKRNRLAKIEAGNERSYKDLKEAIGDPRWDMDTSNLRRELFIDFLVEWGIITEEQKLDFDLKFHEKVETTLNETWAKFRQFQAQQKQPKLQVVKKKAPKLVDGQGRPLT